MKAACPLILSKPHATVSHLQESDPQLARRTATEYCAWLYYTPEHTYEMSMLADRSRPDDLKHIFALHNHPFGTRLSATDLRFIEAMAKVHDWEVMTRNGKVRLSIIAFFSKSKDPAAPTCDGFYQYVPATREMMMWTRAQDQWRRDMHGTITWLNERTYRIEAP